MLKLLFLLHRYLGIGLGVVLLLWCLSGFVMMYKPYPELSEAQQLATLAPLELHTCCFLPTPSLQRDVQAAFTSFNIRMLAATPLLELTPLDGAPVLLNLQTGASITSVSSTAAQELAAGFSRQNQLGDFSLLGEIHNDQWTVYGGYNRYRPLYKFSASDAAHTQWYISSKTGEIVQYTNASQRIWAYLGAVVHWLYPTLLREHVTLWSQTVIWLTIAGLFLTSTGIYFGLKQYKLRRNGRKSPYQGLSVWHHYTGLLFGVLTLSWVLSGLFSMNPWGLLEGGSSAADQQTLQGGTLDLADLQSLLTALGTHTLPAGTVKLEVRKVLGSTMLFAVAADATRTRLNANSLQAEPLSEASLLHAAAVLVPSGEAQVEMLAEPDAYYYSHHETMQFPVWRVLRTDANQTRYYLNPQNAALIKRVDTEQRWYRWLFYGLHRGDFAALARVRPIWDLMMWTLLLGVTATCCTGFLMGMRRILR